MHSMYEENALHSNGHARCTHTVELTLDLIAREIILIILK